MTDPVRRQRVEDLCDAALDRDVSGRAAFVEAACAGDETLRREVEALLAYAQKAERFLTTPMGEVAAHVLADEPRASLAGRQIGPYAVLSLLGAGGMGEVYRARDTALGRDVAIKVVPDAFLSDPERLARFEREARVLATLNHPHIGAIYGLDEYSDAAAGRTGRALVLELVEGPTLAALIGRRAGPFGPAGLPGPKGPGLRVDDALRIAHQIATALEAAHEKGIVHRDLKPGNVKITPDGTVKVLDFGLAKIGARDGAGPDVSQSPGLTGGGTRDGVIVGTPAYMSPEQARGQAVDKRTDIWAFGCVLSEMLTGRQAFAGETVSDTIAAILGGEPEWKALPATTPAPVRRLLQRCLEKDPRQRVRDIGDARIELEDVLAGRATGVPVARRGHRERVAWIALAVVTVAAAFALGSVLYPGRAPADTRAYRSSVLPPTGVSLPAEVIPSGRFALSPDGRLLAFVGVETGGVPKLWVQSLDGVIAQPLPGTEGASVPFWSPDSRFIGFFAGAKVKITDAAGGPALTLADSDASQSGATWNRDGVILFASTNSGSPIRRVSASGGAPSPATTLNADNRETRHYYPFFLPDGRHFLYLAVGSETAGPLSPNGIYVTALDSNERKLLVPGGSNAMYAEGYLLFVREQRLMAQPFDVERLELAGEAAPIAEHVTTGGQIGAAGAFTISETGALAYQTGLAEAGGVASTQLVWFDRNGKQLGALGDRARYGNVGLTPDGRRVAVSVFDLVRRTRDIWLFDIARGLRTRFTFDPADEFNSAWSPDGSRVVFNSRRKGHLDLYQKASSGAGSEEELLADDLDKHPVDWSPDGRFILFQVNAPNTGNDLWVLPLLGDRKPFPFLQTPFSEAPGRFSPDGRRIAYGSNESGRNEVYVASFPEPGGKWQVSATGGSWPQWRRDGKELFYLGADNTLMAVTVNGAGSALEVGTVRALFDTRAIALQRSMYDVSPDGQRFLVNTLAEETAPSPITLVVNWPALLKN